MPLTHLPGHLVVIEDLPIQLSGGALLVCRTHKRVLHSCSREGSGTDDGVLQRRGRDSFKSCLTAKLGCRTLHLSRSETHAQPFCRFCYQTTVHRP